MLPEPAVKRLRSHVAPTAAELWAIALPGDGKSA